MVAQIVCFGECMIELSRRGADEASVSYGGDALNTAIYLARLGVPTSFMTALGHDGWSAWLKTAWAGEGVDVSLVAHHPTRLPGIYAISTDETGERSFAYWRDRSAARDLFSADGAASSLATAATAGFLYVTGITLAVLGAQGRGRLLTLARQVRKAGGQVVFDPNYRPRLWASAEQCRQAVLALAPLVSIALPSADDEALLWGDSSGAATLARWQGLGVPEVAVKQGAHGTLMPGGLVAPVQVLRPLDTTGAGDSFNAGYLAARASGRNPKAAAARGGALAAAVIQHPGAIMPREAMPELVAF